MKKRIAMTLLLGAMLAAPAYSADDGQDISFWERLRRKIEMFTPKKKIASTTAVGGVRGAQADAEEVYWKGEAKSRPIDSDELAAFKKALALADAKDMAGAQAAFADFIKGHPDSPLRRDAEQAMAELQKK